MTRRHAAKFMHLITILAMVVQLGVIGYHHHAATPDHGTASLTIGQAGFDLAEQSGHGPDEQAQDNHRHDPLDGDHQECDLCLVKTAFGGTLIPQSTAGLFVGITSTKPHFTPQDSVSHAVITRRYQARAPPTGITIL